MSVCGETEAEHENANLNSSICMSPAAVIYSGISYGIRQAHK
jgi:hypothetical protein